MKKSDVFVILDDVQFARQTFTCRNRIIVNRKELWISVPFKHKGAQNINEVEIDDVTKHWRCLSNAYSKTPYFEEYSKEFEKIYSKEWKKLIDLDMALIELMNKIFGIKTKIVFSSELHIEERGEEKLINIVKKLKADIYLTGWGPGSKRYIKPENWKKAGIKLIYQDFKCPEYPQPCGVFIPNLSALDYLFNCGEKMP